MRTRILQSLFAVTLVIGAAGCAARTSVAELKYNPGRFENKTVSVEGVVTSAWGVPLLPFQLYKVDDGTGEVTVVSQSGRTPSKGARVRVTGRVEDVATLGGRPLGLHLQEREIDYKGR
jgi:hypothetical protein